MRGFLARKLVALGGEPIYREDVVTDNGNEVIDVYHLNLTDVVTIDHQINQIPGVIAHGLFPRGLCDKAIVAGDQGLQVLEKQQMSFDFVLGVFSGNILSKYKNFYHLKALFVLS